MSTVLRDPRVFVQKWMELKQVEVTPSGSLKFNKAPVIFASLMLDYHEQLNAANAQISKDHFEKGTPGRPALIKPMSRYSLEDAWEDYPNKMKAKARQAIIDRVAPYVGASNELEKWLVAVTGKADPVDAAVMRHFIWQVKRKMLKLPVVYHICPIFFGKQGGGKTTAIQKLISPAHEVVIELGPDEATDSRALSGFTDHYICFFDEMANMARVEMEALKRLITSEKLSFRPLNKNEIRTVEQNCSFIGASNKSLQEVVYDPTGLRRFYELASLDICDFDAVNGINYLAIWGDVDPKLEGGYTKNLVMEMKEHQAERQTDDEVGQFIEEMGLSASGPRKPIVATALYASYVHWRVNAGYSVRPALAISTFGARLATHKLARSKKKIDGFQKTVYDVPAGSRVFDGQLTIVKGGTT